MLKFRRSNLTLLLLLIVFLFSISFLNFLLLAFSSVSSFSGFLRGKLKILVWVRLFWYRSLKCFPQSTSSAVLWVELCPQKTSWSPTPLPQNGTLFGNRASRWVQVRLCLSSGAQHRRGESHVSTEGRVQRPWEGRSPCDWRDGEAGQWHPGASGSLASWHLSVYSWRPEPAGTEFPVWLSQFMALCDSNRRQWKQAASYKFWMLCFHIFSVQNIFYFPSWFR